VKNVVVEQKRLLWDSISASELSDLQKQFTDPEFCLKTNQRLFALSREFYSHGLHDAANQVIKVIDQLAELTAKAKDGTTRT